MAAPELKQLKRPAMPAPSAHRSRRFHSRRPIAVAEDGEGNWLVSYADMMTLLFGFFVLVSAFSTPDAEKIEKLKKATVEYMDAPYVEPTEGLAESLQQVLQDYKLEDDVKIVATEEGLTMSSRGTVFFDSGSAELKPIAQDLLERVGDVIVEMARGFKVYVEGHTDDAPINTSRFPSNWELSAARASVVVRLLETRGFPHAQLRPVGLADVEPTLPNYDKRGRPLEENRARNRRIVIRLQKMLPRRMPPMAPPAGNDEPEGEASTPEASNAKSAPDGEVESEPVE